METKNSIYDYELETKDYTWNNGTGGELPYPKLEEHAQMLHKRYFIHTDSKFER